LALTLAHYGSGRGAGPAWCKKTRRVAGCDIFETENELVLKADAPEVDPKNVEIKLEKGTLTLKGERQFEQDKPKTVEIHVNAN
jgi:HSP20 family molecular chaperone IbpA